MNIMLQSKNKKRKWKLTITVNLKQRIVPPLKNVKKDYCSLCTMVGLKRDFKRKIII